MGGGRNTTTDDNGLEGGVARNMRAQDGGGKSFDGKTHDRLGRGDGLDYNGLFEKGIGDVNFADLQEGADGVDALVAQDGEGGVSGECAVACPERGAAACHNVFGIADCWWVDVCAGYGDSDVAGVRRRDNRKKLVDIDEKALVAADIAGCGRFNDPMAVYGDIVL